MNKGIYILTIIILIILLIAGIILIINKDRISPTNPNSILFIGISLVVVSVLLFGLLTLSYMKYSAVTRTVTAPAISPESFQVRTNQPVLITVTPMEKCKPIEVRSLEKKSVECKLKPVMRAPAEVITTNEYVVPVSITPIDRRSVPQTIVGTI